MTKRGIFITFEGPEGSGKTTQARRLEQRLQAAGQPVLYTREPGGTRTGEAIRGILQHDAAHEPIGAETEVLLFAASRAQLVRRVILPALESGCWVVSDRFADSTTVYQGFGRGFGVEAMLTINAFAIGPATPDLTILLDVPIDLGFARLHERLNKTGQAKDRIELEDLAFHERVRQGYLDLARRWPARFCTVNGAADEAAVAETIWGRVAGLLRPT